MSNVRCAPVPSVQFVQPRGTDISDFGFSVLDCGLAPSGETIQNPKSAIQNAETPEDMRHFERGVLLLRQWATDVLTAREAERQAGNE